MTMARSETRRFIKRICTRKVHHRPSTQAIQPSTPSRWPSKSTEPAAPSKHEHTSSTSTSTSEFTTSSASEKGSSQYTAVDSKSLLYNQPGDQAPAIMFHSPDLNIHEFAPLPSRMIAVREGGAYHPAILLNRELCFLVQRSLCLARSRERLMAVNRARKRAIFVEEQELLGELAELERKLEGIEREAKDGKDGFSEEASDRIGAVSRREEAIEARMEEMEGLVEEMDWEEERMLERISRSYARWEGLLDEVFEGCGLMEKREEDIEEGIEIPKVRYRSRIFAPER